MDDGEAKSNVLVACDKMYRACFSERPCPYFFYIGKLSNMVER